MTLSSNLETNLFKNENFRKELFLRFLKKCWKNFTSPSFNPRFISYLFEEWINKNQNIPIKPNIIFGRIINQEKTQIKNQNKTKKSQEIFQHSQTFIFPIFIKINDQFNKSNEKRSKDLEPESSLPTLPSTRKINLEKRSFRTFF